MSIGMLPEVLVPLNRKSAPASFRIFAIKLFPPGTNQRPAKGVFVITVGLGPLEAVFTSCVSLL